MCKSNGEIQSVSQDDAEVGEREIDREKSTGSFDSSSIEVCDDDDRIVTEAANSIRFAHNNTSNVYMVWLLSLTSLFLKYKTKVKSSGNHFNARQKRRLRVTWISSEDWIWFDDDVVRHTFFSFFWIFFEIENQWRKSEKNEESSGTSSSSSSSSSSFPYFSLSHVSHTFHSRKPEASPKNDSRLTGMVVIIIVFFFPPRSCQTIKCYHHQEIK